ncbi:MULTISPECIES: hypothetical protein [Haloarcula]|uniref:hypothetical protein n=1 Tax=Haloarcula TaxID=2237 RepID=UPI0023ECB86B|nr:hypothetical protein [Halomicroarcula sp. XH51]
MGRATLLVALGVLLAGCGGGVSSGPPETVTPAPVPTDAVRYPPGVTADYVDAATLADAHARGLSTTNYTLTTRQRVRTPDGQSLLRINQTRHVSRDAESYRGHFALETNLYDDAGGSTIEFWGNRSLVVTRYTTANPYREPEIRRWPGQRDPSITDLTDRQHIEGFLAGVNVAPVRQTPDGGVLLAGSGVQDRTLLIVPLVVTEPRNLTLSMRVRPDGVVRATRVTYDATHNGERVRVGRTMRVTAVGTTPVTKPSWVEDGTPGDEYTGFS